ncbi:MAG TPA: 2OG-Fe(II) oxygenase [Thermoanaerobaculia bacterium]|nr:2OG-Fe(II) oxygenase [Thermoanaerobaculia bacterium]
MPPLQLRLDPAGFHDGYVAAAPFPHAALDGLFADDLLEAVLADFPQPQAIKWVSFDSPTEKKLGYSYQQPLGETLRAFLFEMGSPPVLEFLQRLTGIEGLIPDPYLGGAGPHQIVRGGFLKVHADFNWHPLLKLDRRLNLIVYLNQDWLPEYGGHIELWNRDMSRCEQRVLPVFNRTIVFNTTDTSFHGHPTPLACPETMTRKSVSLYYYTNGRPDEERSAPHDTIFKKTHESEW